MKLHLILITAITALAACQNQDAKKTTATTITDTTGSALHTKLLTDTSGYTEIKWIDSVKNIGIIPPAKVAEIAFRFKNTGTKPLFIIDAKPGCGCTITDYPKEAIAPGKEGIIKANYDVKAGTSGEFRKNIHVKTNTKDKTDTYIFFYGRIRGEGETAGNNSRSNNFTKG
ncbi:MAG TPA: DUF1573 domain-containing protein [Segetibacter sp.]|jgi:hypothetical protein